MVRLKAGKIDYQKVTKIEFQFLMVRLKESLI